MPRLRTPVAHQADRFHDYNVASAMMTIALIDCRYVSDRTVLAHAGDSSNGSPYVFKALGVSALQVSAAPKGW